MGYKFLASGLQFAVECEDQYPFETSEGDIKIQPSEHQLDDGDKFQEFYEFPASEQCNYGCIGNRIGKDQQ